MLIKKPLFILTFFILVILILSSCKPENTSNPENEFLPKYVSPGSETAYDINLKMNSSEVFEVEASIDILNTSGDTWDELVFYFIPNIFSDKTTRNSTGTLIFQDVIMDGERVEYSLNKDNLIIPLELKLTSNDSTKVKFIYNFTLPESGLRFTKNKENMYLAQFYPMLATYRNQHWNKEDYKFIGETYHTNFSDFRITFQVSKGYTFVSSSPNDSYPSRVKGTLNANRMKEFFIAILQNPTVIEKEVNRTNIRTFGFDEDTAFLQEITELAADAFAYFEETIGPYPYDQIDIVLDGMSMEYPGIVTAHSIDGKPLDPDFLKTTVVHELAHQWFYGIISNDPYHEAWLDEGFAEFATGLYFYSKPNNEVPYENMKRMIQNLEPMPVNLALDEYYGSSSYIYDKSNVMLWELFRNRGGAEEVENFLKSYYDYYQFKEVNSEEFKRFTQYYFNFKDDSVFEGWLQ